MSTTDGQTASQSTGFDDACTALSTLVRSSFTIDPNASVEEARKQRDDRLAKIIDRAREVDVAFKASTVQAELEERKEAAMKDKREGRKAAKDAYKEHRARQPSTSATAPDLSAYFSEPPMPEPDSE